MQLFNPLIIVDFCLRTLTHNIRYATTSLEKNERPWPERLPFILSELTYNTGFLNSPNNTDAAIIRLQEVLHEQLVGLLAGLNGPEEQPIWAHIGVAQEDGVEKGEYSPILYPVRIFNLLHFENIWLSPTPHKPSKGWDAGSSRILTIGVFEHKKTGRRVITCCTHLDNQGSEARRQSVRIILDKIQQIRDQVSPFCAINQRISLFPLTQGQK